MMLWYGGDGWGWGGWILMTVLMVVFWAVVTAVVLAVRCLSSARSSGATPAARPAAPRIYWLNATPAARIADDEYQQRLTVLRQLR